MSWVGRSLRAWARVARGVERGLSRTTRGLGGAAWTLATPPELTGLGVALGGKGFFSTNAAVGLLPFEGPWFEHLPTPPARLLVLGAGAGREVGPLQVLGYSVDAAEPNRVACDALRERCEGQTWCFTHQDLAAGQAPALNPPYDALLLGWGSVSHVLEAATHDRLLRQCQRLCPEGPILASYWNSPGSLGKPGQLGARVARALGAKGEPPPAGLHFATHTGFLYGFSDAEIRALGDSIGRDSEISNVGTPHVTWRRRDSARSARSDTDERTDGAT